MFCKNCGKELEEGAAFCSACGMQNEPEGVAEQEKVRLVDEEETVVLSDEGETEKSEETEEVQQRFCPNCGCENDASDLFCRECGMSLAVAEQNAEGKKAFLATKGKRQLKWIALGAAFLVVLIFAIWGVGQLVPGDSSGSPFVIYDKENELTAARKNKFAPVIVGDRIQEYVDENGNGSGMNVDYVIRYSEDGKYLYYPQKCSGSEFDLYRKELEKKKDGGTKLVSKIWRYSLIDGDDFVYLKDTEKRKLYFYHKGESEKIASDVSWFCVSENGKYVLWISDGVLRVQATKLKATPQKLDSDVTQVLGMSDDLKNIVYLKGNVLYIVKGLENSERIASDVERAYACDMNDRCKIYYLKSDDASAELMSESEGAEEALAPAEEAPAAECEESAVVEGESFESEFLSYYDLLEDDLLAQDQEITEPMREDYQQFVYTEQDGEQIKMDEEGYEEAWQRYEEKRRRNDLRRKLADSRVDMTEWKVYYYESSKGESSQVLTVNLLSNMNVYGNLMEDEAVLFVGDVTPKQDESWKLSELEKLSFQEAQSRIEDELMASAELLYLRDGQVNKVEKVGENNICYNIYANENKHILYLEYREDDRKAVYRFDYRTKAAPLLVNDEVMYVITADMEKLSYVDEDNTLFYGEREIDGEVGCFAVCDDGKLLYLTDINDDNEGTLRLFEGGESSVEIEENVLAGCYGLFDGEHVAYLTDYSYKRDKGDLGVFMGKRAQIIDTDVNRIYFPEKEPDRNK